MDKINFTLKTSLNSVGADGTAQTVSNQPAIPGNVIIQLHNLRYAQGMTLEDTITFIRGSLVPDGYQPYPFRKDTIVATFVYQHAIQELKQDGVDFTQHLYVPEVDPTDHNHIYKRMAQHVQNGGYTVLNYEAFDDVLKDPSSGLTHTALAGKRKQSLKDAERLLSYHVVHSLERHGHVREAEYVKVLVK